MIQRKDALAFTLELKVAGKQICIPGANIKTLKADISVFGFSALLEFWVSEERGEDELLPLFVKADPVEVILTVAPHFKPGEDEVEPLRLQGLVTEKKILREQTIDNISLKDDPVLYRHYRIDFSDPARVVWGQHFPCDLQVDCSVKDLIEKNNPADVSLDFDWPELDAVYAINTLPCRYGSAWGSFYDFILWFTTTYDGVFSYDFNACRYRLAGRKKDDQDVVAMRQAEVAELCVCFPAPIRYNDRLLNVYSENPTRKETDRDDTLDGTLRTVLVREPIASEFEGFFSLETERQRFREHVIQLEHGRFPQLTYRPGTLIKFDGDLWSDKLFTKDKEYRVLNLRVELQAENPQPDVDHNMPHAVYHLEMQSRLELKQEQTHSLPEFRDPRFPVQVEGQILSEQGTEGDETWQCYEHPQQQTDQYRVLIPVFEDRQILVPFEPLFAPGTFYFPANKGQRVLVELDFHSARIVRFLDWRSGARLPMDSQGDQLLLGKGAQSNTSISHVYVDNKPQLNMKRTSASDTEVIRLDEGIIILETKEDPS
jgi:hypothetical protein